MPDDTRDSRQAAPGRPSAAAPDVINAFRAALWAREIVPPDNIIADGELHRCDAAGKNGRGDAAYLLHLDGVPAGGFENWRDGKGWHTWRFDHVVPLSAQERETLRLRAEAARVQRETVSARRHAEAAILAGRIWNSSQAAPPDHPYLIEKAIASHGLRIYKGALVVPLCDPTGSVSSLQFITSGGSKRFLKGGRVAGCYFVIGEVTEMVCIAEGYATAASIHVATGHPVVVAFSAVNLKAAAEAIRRQHPGAHLILCADDDRERADNPGLVQAHAAARAVGALLAVPAFGDDRSRGVTDFNDLHRLHGTEAVCEAIAAAHVPHKAMVHQAFAGESSGRDWPDPEPLAEQLTAHPYPLGLLPPLIRDAVKEVQGFVQAPAALVACSALAVLSLASQGLVNVRRDQQLVGPVSIYLLSVADSGERKTTCDAMFSQALRDWQIERRQALVADIARAEAAAAVFEAKKAGILEAIKLKRRKGEDTVGAERELQGLVRDAPQPLRVPRLLYADATPEALAFSLANGWPSGGVLSAEAGAVFGAHSMSQETILRNLALLNVLWDGGEMAIDRRSKPSFELRGRRLTFGLMIQPDALRGFLERAGTLPRGTGFLARFLIAWPASTQGSRRYRPAPSTLSSVERYARRILELLDEPLVADERGCLCPIVLDLSPAARTEWVSFHDCVEDEIGAHGEFRDIRDVAAKAAENVARLAALFHVLERGPAGPISVDAVAAATAIITWHLGEARRLLGELDTPPGLAAAIRLDEWLRREARAGKTDRISTRRIFQYGPKSARDNQAFKSIVALLTERGRARLENEGRRRYVVINPALLDEGV